MMANKIGKFVKGAIPFLAIMGLASISGEIAADNVTTSNNVALSVKVERTTNEKVNAKDETRKEVKAFASNSKMKSTTCNGCSGSCSGTCSGLCLGCHSCSGTCSGLCAGCSGCQGTCSGTCSGSCSGYK